MTIDECIASTERRGESMTFNQWQRYSAGLLRKGEKQIRCGACGRWMHDSERCELFVPIRAVTVGEHRAE